MVAEGLIPAEKFVNVRSDTHEFMVKHLVNDKDVVKYFKDYKDAQVCVRCL